MSNSFNRQMETLIIDSSCRCSNAVVRHLKVFLKIRIYACAASSNRDLLLLQFPYVALSTKYSRFIADSRIVVQLEERRIINNVRCESKYSS